MKNEWLASILGDNVTLTDELDAAVTKQISKMFVSKSDFNDKAAKLNEVTGQVEEYQRISAQVPELQQKLEAATKAHEKVQAEATVKEVNAQIMRTILKAGARDENAVYAMLDQSKIQVDPEKGISGLNEQLEALQTEKAWAFNGGEATSRAPAGGTPDATTVDDIDAYMNSRLRGK